MAKVEKVYATQVTIDEFLKYLQDMEQTTQDCPTCGNDAWDIPNDGQKPTLISFPSPSPDPNAKNIWAFYITCRKCGFMRYYLASTVTISIKVKNDG